MCWVFIPLFECLVVASSSSLWGEHHLQAARRGLLALGRLARYSIHLITFKGLVKRVGEKVIKLVKNNFMQEKTLLPSERVLPLTSGYTCSCAALLLTQPVILMPDNWIVSCQEDTWRQFLQGLALSSGMQLLNSLTGKHSTTLAQLPLMSLSALLFFLVATDACFC